MKVGRKWLLKVRTAVYEGLVLEEVFHVEEGRSICHSIGRRLNVCWVCGKSKPGDARNWVGGKCWRCCLRGQA